MFKLFQNFLPAEAKNETDSAITPTKSSSSNPWSTQIAQADHLWEQGKLSEALAIYALTIKENPEVVEIKKCLAERLKQQGDLAIAYEKLATGLKNQGNIEQAANYYRQAIHIKALTGNTKEQIFRSSNPKTAKSPIPIADLKTAAFSFQPLTRINSAVVKTSPSLNLNVEANPGETSPSFSQRLKLVNPQQAKDINWETAQVYLQKALEHTEKQEWEQAALACQQATQMLPEMAEAYKIWGNALQRMGKTGEAMSCYARAVEIQPNLAEVYSGIADIYTQQEKWQAAIKHYQKAIIIKPSAEIYRSLANAWEQLGEPKKAQLNLYQAEEIELSGGEASKPETFVELDSITVEQADSENSVESYCRLAKKLEQTNQWKQAAKYYRKALDLSISQPTLPPSAASEEQATEVELETKLTELNSPEISDNLDEPNISIPASQLDKAIKRYHKQSKLQPNSPKIHTDLGNLYARKAKWQYAIACYYKAIELNPKYADAHLNLARIFLRIGKQKEFIKAMQLALALKPRIGSAIDRFYLGNALVDQGQQQQAISFYHKAILLNPRFTQSYHRLSEILSKQKQHQEAVKCLEQGIHCNPHDPESYYFLGQQWEMLENWGTAVKMYGKVLQLEPQYPGASQKLNHALAEKLKVESQVKQQHKQPE
ncbi:MAG: tetratricopeptide repeat protein [Waterburya sp.]